MGFLDALKSVANMVTGGAATVGLELGTRNPDGSIPARITAEVAGADLKIEKVYLKVEGHETVTVRIKKENLNQGTNPMNHQEHDETFSASTYTQDINVAAAQTLKAKEKYSWDTIIQIPKDAQPTYAGRLAKHEWRAYAGLDATGTDPASSWISFVI